jgi:hypothetical protein
MLLQRLRLLRVVKFALAAQLLCFECWDMLRSESSVTDMARDSDYGAFMEKFLLQPSPSADVLPLNALTFAVKDM